MKKFLSLLLSVVMLCTMLGAFGLTASAAVAEYPEGQTSGSLGYFKGIIYIYTVDDLDEVYETWKNTTKYDSYTAIIVKSKITITKSYDFTKGDLALSLSVFKNITIEEGASLKVGCIEFLVSSSVNNGTIILTRPDNQRGAFYASFNSSSSGLTNNGTIQMLNTDKIMCYSDTVDQYPIINKGVIQTPSGKANYIIPNFKTNVNGDVYLDPASTGSIEKLPIEINSPDTTGGSDVTLSATTIPAPTYTVTIPKTIDFGTCEKAMVNDTAENKIKEITVDDLTITHSNLFVNEKKITVTMSSDFTIKNGENALSFDLFDGNTKLATNAVLITANPTAEDTAVNDNKSLTAKLDKTQIKKSGTYQGTVTFTVAMLDIA